MDIHLYIRERILSMELNASILKEIEDSRQEALDLLMELGKIPAPSNHEEKRAEFCKAWLEKQGAEGVYIDEALNVVSLKFTPGMWCIP